MSTVIRAWNLRQNVTGTESGDKNALDVNVVNSLTTTPGPVQFVKDGTDIEVSVDTATPANSEPLPVTILDENGDAASFASETTLDAIKTAVETLDNAISGSEMQVDIVAALPAGTNNIGDVDVVTLPSLPAGTNNIGDVDVLSLPSLPAGTNNIGDVDVASLPGTVATDITAIKTAVEILDNAISGSEMQVDVVTLPALPSGTNRIGSVDTNLDVVDFIDTTPVLDTSSSNIAASASSPTEVVASLAANVKKITVNDTTGEFIGVYTGAAASEVLQCVIGPGKDGDIEVQMASGSRVSVRNMANAAISTGKLCIQFLG